MLLSALLLVIAGPPVQAHTTSRIETPTATPDANQILNQANAVATQAAITSSQADRAAAGAQATLNVVNFIITFFSLLVGAVGVLAGVLISYGISIINRYRSQLNENQAEVAKRKTAIDNTLKALVYLGLGDRLFNQRKTEEAIEIYRKVNNLLPEDSQMNNVLGRIYSGAGYYDDAIKSFNTALAADPDLAEAHMELGLTYRRHGDVEQGPDAEALRDADYNRAIEHLKRAIDLRPNYEDALAGLGAVYRRKGDTERDLQHDQKAREYYELARGYYEQAYNVSPFSSYALGNVASLSWYLGGRGAAYDYFVLARAAAKVRIKNGGPSPELYWDYYDLALAELVMGTVDKNETMKGEAIASYKSAIRLTPGTVQLDSVLNNLYLLQKSQEHIDKLDTVVALLRAAKSS
jgi:tetratricopeptide (TPR) repeat protein